MTGVRPLNLVRPKSADSDYLEVARSCQHGFTLIVLFCRNSFVLFDNHA